MALLKSIMQKLAWYRLIKIRQRYFFTKAHRVRLRYVAGSMGAMSIMMTSLMGASSTSIAFATRDTSVLASIQDRADEIVASAYQPKLSEDAIEYANISPAPLSRQDLENIPVEDEDGLSPQDLAALEPASGKPLTEPKPKDMEQIVKLNEGETVVGALQNVGVSAPDAYNVVKALSEHIDPRAVKAGQSFSVKLEPVDTGLSVAQMNIKLDSTKEVVVSKNGDQAFKSEIKEKEIFVRQNAVKALISNSLYGSAARAGIPASIVAELIRIYSYEVDFQRDIREGDKLEVLFETYETEDGEFAHYGNVVYANLMVEGKTIPIYRFEPEKGRADYYREDGVSVRKTLMKTPVDGARISSGFGMRRHPVLGYNKMHKGMDFAASVGTPIYAAGDGVVEFIGRKGSYGNYVALKHNGALKSAYAHMHKFAKGLKSGQKVEQGQVIGYVGTTGRSTGPHLHFEIIKNGRQINPTSLKMTGQQLAGKELRRFKEKIKGTHTQYMSMTENMKFAKNEIQE